MERLPVRISRQSAHLYSVSSINKVLSGIPLRGMTIRGDIGSHEEVLSTIDTSNLEVPVVFSPEDMYMHTIAARPNFEDIKLPAKSFTYMIVNIMMVSALIAGAVLDITTDHGGPTLS